MQPAINIAVRAARQACEELLFAFDKHHPSLTDYDACSKQLTYMNALAYKIIFEALKKAYPKAYIAKQGVFNAHNTESSWHISFIQGSDNLLRRIPAATISITNRKNQKIEHALVISIISGEEFSASKGRGAELNDKKIRVSPIIHFDQAMIYTNLYRSLNKDTTIDSSEYFPAIVDHCQSFRVSGSNVLDLCYVAAGKSDACVLTNIELDDLGAGLLICQEAGVLTGDFSGSPLSNNSKKVIAGNAKLFKFLSQKLATLSKTS